MSETRDWRRSGRGVAAWLLAAVGVFGLTRGFGTQPDLARDIVALSSRAETKATGAFELDASARLSSIDLDETERRLNRLSFRARSLAPESVLEWIFRAGDRGAYVLALRFSDRLHAELSHTVRPGESLRLASGVCDVVDEGVDLSLHCDDDRIAVFAGDETLLSVVHDGPRNGRIALRAVSGRVAVDRFGATGLDSTGSPYSFVGSDSAEPRSLGSSAENILSGLGSILALLAFLFVSGHGGPARRFVLAALSLVLTGIAIDRATRGTVHPADHDRHLLARVTQTREPFHSDEVVSLDASNSFVIPGSRAAFRTTLRLSLGADSVFEVRMRCSNTRAAGIAWVGSTRDALGSGFVRQETMRSSAIGSRGRALDPDREFELSIECDGSNYLARVDGEIVSRAQDARFAAGPIVLLSARGTASLRSVAVEPHHEPSLATSARNGLSPAVGFLIAAAALLAVFARHRLEDALGLAAITLLPCASLQIAPPQYRDIFVVGFVSFLALVVSSQVRARAVGIVLAHLALVASLVTAPCGVIAIAQAAPLAVETQDLGSMRLMRDLVHFQHPSARQLNDYLATHRFRGREHTLTKPEGTRRVVCLGTSSTWGYGFEDGSGFDYPTILERRMNASGRSVETLNAAYPGTHAHCLERVLADQLRDFEFDVVTVSLTYNDSYATTQSDGNAEFEKLVDLHPWLRVLVGARARSRVLPARIEMQRLIAEFSASSMSTTEVWRSFGHTEEVPAPVARFEASLRRMAETVRRRGAKIVFMKEPLRGDLRMIWKDEFRAAIDRVAADFGGFVADPTPALLSFRGPKLFQDDVHPTAEGNEIVARVLEEVVVRALDSP